MAKKVEFNMAAAKKYLFWVCAPIGLVVAVAAALMAIGSTATELKTLKEQFENQKSAMGQLRSSAASHPNEKTIEDINRMRQCQVCASGGDCSVGEGNSGEEGNTDEKGKAKCLFRSVLAAWETLERAQKSQNQWPELATSALNDIKRQNFLDELNPGTLTSYREFARTAINGTQTNRGVRENCGLLEFPNDIRRVETRRQQDNQWITIEQTVLTESRMGGSVFGPSAGGDARRATPLPGDQLRGKVVWNSPDLGFTIRNWERVQSFEVWLMQEDLWVYQALLWVIAEANKGVQENGVPVSASGTTIRGESSGGTGAGGRPLDLSRSVVKEIIDLAIGKKAARALQVQSGRRISRASSAAFGGEDGSYEDSSSSGSFGDSGGGFGESDGTTMALSPEAARTAALARRYVDADGEPLPEPDLTKQFRRMPIYLNLRVDQRYISDVLVHCANCPMPIDVLWVTVNPDNTKPFEYISATATTTGSGETSFGFGAQKPSAGGSAMRPTAPGGAQGLTAGSIDYGPNEVNVEIFGCINIFAPPDPEKIGGGK